ncbi:MAG TPA: hypothetical protein DIW23_00125 [Anaerolineae bacterium]|nr:hypothetical protein [Anaerolineae bacterium]
MTNQTGAPEEIKKLHILIGNWNVEFQTRLSENDSFVTYQVKSSIVSILGGAFLQEQIVIPASNGKVELMGILGYDRYRNVYRFSWLDDTYAVFDIHEGNWEGDKLVVNNLCSGTTFRFQGQEIFSGMTWRDITKDSFTMESNLSFDGGKTWFTQAIANYTRA